MLIFWIIVFIISLTALVKGADWLLNSAERIGLALGLSAFIIGVTIVGIGTSLPELISSVAAVFQGVSEIVAANVIGSNVANILLIIGLAAVISRKVVVGKSLIDLDLPLLAVATVLFIGVAIDQTVTLPEIILLLIAFAIYLLYTVRHKEDDTDESIAAKAKEHIPEKTERKPKLAGKDFVWLIVGLASLGVGANYVIQSVVEISDIVGIPSTLITLLAVAVGTSLPELLVSVKAARKGNAEVAVGNIIGSCVFNLLVVIGVSGLFAGGSPLPLDAQTFGLALPMMAAATLLFIFAGIGRRFHNWEGALFLVLYAFFVGKLFDIL